MITYKQLERVRQANAKLSDNTKRKITEVIERTKPQGEEVLRRAILEELAPVMAEADEIAAQMSAAIYNHWRYAALGLTTDTVTESAYDYKKVEAMANTAAKAVREGETVEAVISIVNGRASYDIRKSYGDTMMANAGRDKHEVRFARIPGTSEHYADGCPFCRMLASRGFVYHSKATAGEFGHYHDGCTCEIVAQFDKNPKVEGYDPDAYYEEYLAARDYAKTHFGDKTVTAEDIAKAYREMGRSGKNSVSTVTNTASKIKDIGLDEEIYRMYKDILGMTDDEIIKELGTGAYEETGGSQRYAGLYKESRSVKDASDVLSMFTTSTASYDENIPSGLFNQFNEAVSHVAEKFGLPIDIVRVRKASRDVQGAYDASTRTMKIKKQTEKYIEKNYASGWNASNHKYATYYHEIGHAVYKDLSSAKKSEVKGIFEDIRHKAFEEWKARGGSRSRQTQAEVFKEISGVSRYAHTDHEEFFSECLSQIMSGHPSEYARKIERLIM